jgi:hypothetical protein
MNGFDADAAVVVDDDADADADDDDEGDVDEADDSDDVVTQSHFQHMVYHRRTKSIEVRMGRTVLLMLPIMDDHCSAVYNIYH